MTSIEIVLLAALVLTITMIAAHHDDDRHHGPLTPVLDADGLPLDIDTGRVSQRRIKAGWTVEW